jgi:hypothetical protein
LPAERDWHELTGPWWEDVWSSPMAAEYLAADRHGLFRLAVLVDDYWLAGSPSARRELAGEIRLQGQAFGLTPLDRRRLEWRLRRPRTAPSASGDPSPRRATRA